MRFHFCGYVLDLERCELHRGDQPVSLEPQVFDLLVHLVRHRDRVVSKDELIATVWGGRIVSDTTIDSRVKGVRQAVGDSGAVQRVVRTVPRKGVRFVADVRVEAKQPTLESVPVTAEPVAAPSVMVSDALPLPDRPSIAVTDVQDRRLNSLPAVAIALPDKPSIAVLAFTNMSGPEQEHLSDGVADDIITELSRYPSLFVIARNSSFAYKGRSVDVRQIQRELDVRYVLEGSLRRAGGQLRVTAQLVDAGTGRHVWAERYDRHLTDILAILDEITNEVVIAIAPAISVAEQQRAMRRTTGTLDAWAAYQRGMWHLNRVTAEDNTLAHNFFQQAIDLDPNFSGGYKGLCATLSNAPDYWGTRLADKLDLAETMARQAIALDSNDAEARVLLAIALRRRGDCKGSLAEVEHALALCPNLAGAHAARGAVLIYSGRPEEGVPELEKSIRLDPHRTAVRLNQIAMGLYLNGDYRASVEASNRAIRSYPLFPNSYRWLAAALGQLGEIPGARKALDRATNMASAAFEMYVRKRPPFVREEDFQHMLKGLRNAGWTPKNL